MRALLVAVFTMAILGVANSQNEGYQQDPGWHAPGEAAARPNPLAKRPDAASGGAKLFKRNCVECHGENGTGLANKHSADLRLDVVQKQSDGTLFWKITNGNTDRGMPSFSRLPELQRWQLVLYLRNLNSASKLKAK
jgi:mono/diheme cytochrome c family protein